LARWIKISLIVQLTKKEKERLLRRLTVQGFDVPMLDSERGTADWSRVLLVEEMLRLSRTHITRPDLIEGLFREIGFEQHLDGDRIFLHSCYLAKYTPNHLGIESIDEFTGEVRPSGERIDWGAVGVRMRSSGGTEFTDSDFTLRFFDTRSAAA